MKRLTKISLSILNHVVFFPKRMSITAESRMFLKGLISCQSFSMIRPWFDVCTFLYFQNANVTVVTDRV